MDNLVLIRVVSILEQTLTGAILAEFREDGPSRFRLHLRQDDRPRTVVISIDPERPWIGRPALWREKSPSRSGPFTAACVRHLRGRRVVDVAKPPADRTVCLRFADGPTLVAELAPRGANLVLLDASGTTLHLARRSRRSHGRLVPGRSYAPPPLPTGKLDPFSADVASIDARLAGEGEAPSPATLSRACVGLGAVGARLVLEESERCGRSLGEVLGRRIRGLIDGELDPVIETPGVTAEGDIEPSTARLLPWLPDGAFERDHRSAADAAMTAGLYHETLDRFIDQRRRARGLLGQLAREIRRIRTAEKKVLGDGERFADPDGFRRWAEALLAGLRQARRVGSAWLVPDPYDVSGASIVIPAEPAEDARRTAERYFELHRRARRGREAAGARSTRLASRRASLERLANDHATLQNEPGSVAELERAMQGLGIAVGLATHVSGRGAAPGRKPPRVEGVRLFAARDGSTVMVGKSGRDNQRLTFKLAAPEDFWLHALGVRGAHVILRNETRRPRPAPGALEEAACAAAWYSEASRDGTVEVQWTRRKYVRQIRGASPGTVRLKKFETLRVRPRRPDALIERD